MNTLIRFAHRKNPDSSIDSICTTCFETLASEDSVDKLIAHEERHSCDPHWQFADYPEQAAGLLFRHKSRGTAQRCR
jgi:hypothetical protein